MRPTAYRPAADRRPYPARPGRPGARRARPQHAKIIAVTGSAGKTTTKEILRPLLHALGRTHASAASYNNHWGVPLSAWPRCRAKPNTACSKSA